MRPILAGPRTPNRLSRLADPARVQRAENSTSGTRLLAALSAHFQRHRPDRPRQALGIDRSLRDQLLSTCPSPHPRGGRGSIGSRAIEPLVYHKWLTAGGPESLGTALVVLTGRSTCLLLRQHRSGADGRFGNVADWSSPKPRARRRPIQLTEKLSGERRIARMRPFPKYQARPPSTHKICPVIQPARSDPRNKTALAISSAAPRRRMCMDSISLCWPCAP